MNSIIIAHLPVFDTWQSSCILFGKLPFNSEENRIYLYDNLIYKRYTHESILWKEHKLKIILERYNLTIFSCSKNGDLGNCICFYSNGKDHDIFTVIGTLAEGKYNNYDEREDSNPYDEEYYNHGKFISYDQDGNIKDEGNYAYGNLHGKYIEYHMNGKVEKECDYENGKKHGKYIEYRTDGKIEKECNYEGGKKHGKYIEYYENGDIKEERYYVHGKLHR